MTPLLCTFLLAADATAANRWEEVARTRDGIRVRARIDKARGQGETLAQGLIKAPLEKVWAVLADVARYQSSCPI